MLTAAVPTLVVARTLVGLPVCPLCEGQPDGVPCEVCGAVLPTTAPIQSAPPTTGIVRAPAAPLPSPVAVVESTVTRDPRVDAYSAVLACMVLADVRRLASWAPAVVVAPPVAIQPVPVVVALPVAPIAKPIPAVVVAPVAKPAAPVVAAPAIGPKLTARVVAGRCGKCKANVPIGGMMGLSSKGAMLCAPCCAADFQRATRVEATVAKDSAAFVAAMAPKPAKPAAPVPASKLTDSVDFQYAKVTAAKPDTFEAVAACPYCAAKAKRSDVKQSAADTSAAAAVESHIAKAHPVATVARDVAFEADAAAVEALMVLAANVGRLPVPPAPAPKPTAPKGPAPKVDATPTPAPAVEAPRTARGFTATVNTRTLRAVARRAAKVAPRKCSLPLLQAVVVKQGPAGLEVEATDLNVTYRAALGGESGPRVAVLVNAKAFKDAVPAGHGTVRIAFDGEALTVGDATLRPFSGADVSDWPVMPREGGVCRTVDARIFERMLRTTAPAVATDASRYHLSGVMLGNRDGAGVAVATDGHRLHMDTAEDAFHGLSGDVIVPLGALAVLTDMVSGATSASVGAEGINLTARIPGESLVIKLVDAQFPPYEMVIPKLREGSARVNVKSLATAAGACRAINKAPACCAVDVDPAGSTVRLTASNKDTGAAVSKDVAAVVTGEPIRIGVSARYLGDALDVAATDAACFTYGGAFDPIILDFGYGRLAVIMPVRL